MAPSSTDSWAGANADIIDLDRYMRGSVRPPRTLNECEKLVVDGGGVTRKVVNSSVRYKLYSNDSGVSDGSYVQCRVHRPRSRLRARSSDSLRAFRVICEQALIDQQQQIARIAQLCEWFTERANIERPNVKVNMEPVPPPSKENRLSGSRVECTRVTEKARRGSERSRRAERAQSESSDITSSSRSTMDLRRKEKLRAQECKTYKIIMSKLDELNRRFTAPRAAPSPALRPRLPACTPSSSVSVCDKLVATDPDTRRTSLIRPAVQTTLCTSTRAPSLCSPRVVTQAYSVDIAPREYAKSPNVATESVVKRQASCASGSSAAGDRFDLDVPLYSQGKRAQSLNATTTRPARGARTEGPRAPASGAASARSPSLCSTCRSYWRSLRWCLVSAFAQDS